jgi:hypothetical protein
MSKRQKDQRKKQRLRQSKREFRIAEVGAIRSKSRVLGRECGTCIACCTTMGVAELDKKAGEECVHTCDKGCAIYDSRPDACQRWNCMWIAGYLPEALKPEECGVIWDSSHHELVDRELFTVREVRPGALEGKDTQEWLARVISKMMVLAITHDGKLSILGPTEQVKKLEAYILEKSKRQNLKIGTREGIKIDIDSM